MAKKEIRMLTASGDMAAVVDRGSDLDTQIKNLTFEDKGIKTKLTETFSKEIGRGETSVKVGGTRAAAVITAAESVAVDYASDKFAGLMKDVESGLLDGVVERKMSLLVPSEKVKEAAEVLKKAGLNASVTDVLSVKAETLRNTEAGSAEQGKALANLKACVKVETTYRVKYEKVQE